jgi:hypothetical protein
MAAIKAKQDAVVDQFSDLKKNIINLFNWQVHTGVTRPPQQGCSNHDNKLKLFLFWSEMLGIRNLFSEWTRPNSRSLALATS